ncbi:MAG: hypothetical protein JSV81_19430 [Anaerolineales bacterium]|nr:MAG: hypothetical protein JSV81_19430 [Anaerolineales bacterium]
MQDLRGTRVLLIDDQPDFLNLLKHFFRQEGAQVFTAPTERAACASSMPPADA